MQLLFLDIESIGLSGMPVLLQFAVDDGPITLYDIWKEPVGKTIDLIEWMLQFAFVGFNNSFDHFMLSKLYTIWRLLPRDWIPEEHIEQIAKVEPLGKDGPCIKFASVCDLLLHSRKNQYQCLMAREDIRIRRVPTALAYPLSAELESRIELDGIFFAKFKDKEAPKWRVYDIFREGELVPEFKDVVLKFAPAGGLKFLAEYALGLKPKYLYDDIKISDDYRPYEYGYAPTALAVSTPEQNWEVWVEEDGKRLLKGYAWPALIKQHIEHWATNERAREYAQDDIVFTRGLYNHFNRPEPGDDDSVLACMVATVLWHGFEVDIEGMEELLLAAKLVVATSPVNVNKPSEVRRYLSEMMSETEAMFIAESTEKEKLKEISNWQVGDGEECVRCNNSGDTNCKCCGGIGKFTKGLHPAATRSKELLAVKKAVKEIQLYEKLIRAKRFHANFSIIGTLSSRMAGGEKGNRDVESSGGRGGSGLNPQAINKSKEVRGKFPLKWNGRNKDQFLAVLDDILGCPPPDGASDYCSEVDYELCGGDFDSFEVTLADAVYNDPELRKALITRVDCNKCNCSGEVRKCEHKDCKGCTQCVLVECDNCEGCGKATKKIHGLFGTALFPGKTYEEILASEGSKELDMYTLAKSGVFAMIYGGNAETLHRNLGIAIDVAEAAYITWGKMFPGIEKARQRIIKQFCSMLQPGGIGTQVIWSDPDDYCETFLGFRRYFTLENKICKELFRLAQAPPKEWKACPVKVVRRDRIQTAGGAVSSALYGAAFSLQQTNMRAAANHEIQSPGGQITKTVQRRIWDLQPAGVHPLYVAPMNIHDEIECVTHPEYVDAVAEVVRESVERFRPAVALIGMTWNKSMLNWAYKKSGSDTIRVRAPEMEPPAKLGLAA